MLDRLSIEPETLEWAGRLSALLLNDGTDAMRWFLMDNLPRIEGCEPNLSELLHQNRQLFATLRDQACSAINHEMFDILFSEDGKETNSADLEISLLFFLIRYLCQSKHPTWKWWDEEPLNHQLTPLFDVIRLFKFKQKMKRIVHNYEITKQSFLDSLNYITSVLDRLRSYRISCRRWQNDVIKIENNDVKRNIYVRLTEVMRWQTLNLAERDRVYLALKESRRFQLNVDPFQASPWSEFIAQFGQKRAWSLSCMNEAKSEQAAVNSDFLCKITSSPACELSQCEYPQADSLENKLAEYRLRDKELVPLTRTTTNEEEKEMVKRITNDVFVEDSSDGSSTCIKSRIHKSLKEFYISRYYAVYPLPSHRHLQLHMDDVVCNVAIFDHILDMESQESIVRKDVPIIKPKMTPLTSWRNMLIVETKPLRLMVSGEWSSGKTTLLRKVAYEWATCNCPELFSYKFVFYIDASLVTCQRPYTSLSECILYQTSSVTKFRVDEIESLFQTSDGSEILLLVDGIERLPDLATDTMSEIKEIICGTRWPASSIIATTSFHTTNKKVKTTSSSTEFHNNINLVLTQSCLTWIQISVAGFNTHDVITHACHYFKSSGTKTIDYSSRAKHFLQSTCVFQRDVYKGVMTSPMMTYILCSTWMLEQENNQSPSKGVSQIHKLPETLSEMIGLQFAGLNLANMFSAVGEEALHRTLIGNSGNMYTFASKETIKDMLHLLLCEVPTNGNDTVTKFIHVLCEDYFAAWYLCSNSCDEEKCKIMMEEYVSSLQCAIRLRYFLLFCCYLNKEIADVVITHLSSLVENTKHTTYSSQASELKPLQEAIKHLCLQIFYETNSISTHSLLPESGDDRRQEQVYREDGNVLRLRYMNFLSHRSQQAILFLTYNCKPKLTRFGTVFPFLSGSSFWLRKLHFSRMRGNQTTYAGTLLKNLPFLEECLFEDVHDVTDADVANLSGGLTSFSSDYTISALHTLVFTLATTSIQVAPCVTTYETLGEAAKCLPYLEKLELTLTSSSLLFSLFVNSEDRIVIPLTVVDLSNMGLNVNLCNQLAAILDRLIFVEKLILAQNPIYDGLEAICEHLHHLQRLQVLDVSQACLTATVSIKALARALICGNRYGPLRSLDLSGNNIQTCSAMTMIAEAIRHLAALEYLNLSDNYLGDSGICVLAKSLKENGRMKNLLLDFVQMSSIGLSSLKMNLKECSSLQIVSLAGNYCGSQILEFVHFSKHSSDTLKYRGLQEVEELNLSGVSDNMPIRANRNSILTFLAFIESHLKIKRLILHHIQMDESDLIRLLDICQRHPTLQSIQLSSKFIALEDHQKASWSRLVTVRSF